ncbi:HAMP domain-containing histidine kinase [Nocardioides sp. zg-536]|uniref:Sensor-like histidine kinase SenX3 n=1 Tax=Nocardioides faecalis TaxID=2803858 RepID=A0A938Y535_9ACTN|nr:HAMP domain-containing sensor histidine kinase [Nocardioides faecalis]MBM9460188.1 HAMP domain-containing histidine kinase [Nocardioides faecalis]MBS4754690.1 HAMP domain-containing histidine kinase [Nocardioides faecalis]QVI60018.1 HAMP domain-containing histidine kinase [Nocardioides faecalis]
MEIRPALSRTLHLIAEGVVEFSGFQVAAVSLVDGADLTTVAVVGLEDARARLLGSRVPRDLLVRELEPASTWGALCFLPAERSRGNLEPFGRTPPLPRSRDPEAWDPGDLLCGLLRDDDGQVRGVLTVDMPRDGLRPGLEQRHILQRYVRFAERAMSVELERGAAEERMEREHAIAEYRRRLLDGLSHELRSSTAAIEFTVALLRRRLPSTGAAGEVVDRLTLDAQRLGAVVEDMSALVRLAQQDRPLTRRPVELAAVVHRAVAAHEVAARLSDVGVLVTADDGVVVAGDEEDLARMVSNLVCNAITYSHRGGQVRVDLVARREPDRIEPAVVVLRVADAGIGIAPQDRRHLFQESFRSDAPEVQARPGAGLGLAVVEKVVRQHGGLIDIESLPGQGTVVEVLLPSAALAAGQENDPEGPPWMSRASS